MTSNVEENPVELECLQCRSICLNPHYLHCFHSICFNCLNEFNENPLKIFCSKCQIETKVWRFETNENESLKIIFRSNIEMIWNRTKFYEIESKNIKWIREKFVVIRVRQMIDRFLIVQHVRLIFVFNVVKLIRWWNVLNIIMFDRFFVRQRRRRRRRRRSKINIWNRQHRINSSSNNEI